MGEVVSALGLEVCKQVTTGCCEEDGSIRQDGMLD